MSVFIDFMRLKSAVAQDHNSFAVLTLADDAGGVVKVYFDAMIHPQALADAFNNPGRVKQLTDAIEALGAMPEGYCFCSKDRIGDDSKIHEPECRDLRAVLGDKA